MRHIMTSAFGGLLAGLTGLCLLPSETIAKTLTRGTPAEWKSACEANPRACFASPQDGGRIGYKICSQGRCFVISCGTTDDTGHCEKHDAPGVRPRAKQMQWPVSDLL